MRIMHALKRRTLLGCRAVDRQTIGCGCLNEKMLGIIETNFPSICGLNEKFRCQASNLPALLIAQVTDHFTADYFPSMRAYVGPVAHPM